MTHREPDIQLDVGKRRTEGVRDREIKEGRADGGIG